jgi:hypothetical protein
MSSASPGSSPARRRRRGLSAAWVIAIPLLVPHAPRIAPEVTLKLVRAGGVTTVSQGVAFRYKVLARNSGGTTQSISVTIELDDPGANTKDISLWTASVPAGGSATVQLSEVSSQWFEALGTFTLVAKLDGVPNGNTLTYTVTSPTVIPPVFQDVTASSGLSTTLPNDANRSHSGGAAWADVNGDGHLDLFVPIRNQPAQLWIWQEGTGTFQNEAPAWGVTNPGGRGVAAVFADFDNDGDPDLYVINDAIDPATALPTDQGNRLYRNELTQGSTSFTDVTASAGVGTQGNGASASWGDYDGDGFLDLYAVTNNAFNEGNPGGPQITYYQQDHLYHNEGNGTFRDVTCENLPTNDQASGFCPGNPTFGGSTGSGFEAVWIDYDRDGDPDLYLAQDYFKNAFHIDSNRLYRNDGFDPGSGHWKFTDMCQTPGRPECMAISSMGIAVGDFNGDLWPDMAISNVGSKGGNALLQNNRDGTFVEVGAHVGIARPIQEALINATTWGLGFYDFNLDGSEDLYVAAGSNRELPEQPNQLFVNTPGSTFLDLSAPSHAADPSVSHGVAFADYDVDGLMDFYVVNANGSPILYRNVTATAGSWLEVKLTGTASNRDACGASVVLTNGTKKWSRWVLCGASLGAGSDTALHFGGLGADSYTLDVTWPSGTTQRVHGSGVDRLVFLTEN